jgi:hypothetical protein
LARFLGKNRLLDAGTGDESQVFLRIADVRVLRPCGYQPTGGHELPIATTPCASNWQLAIGNRQ